jgi:hypothetical protein
MKGHWSGICSTCLTFYAANHRCPPEIRYARLAAGYSPRRPGFESGCGHVVFVVDKVTLGRCSVNTLVSPANDSTDCCTSVIMSQPVSEARYGPTYQMNSTSPHRKKPIKNVFLNFPIYLQSVTVHSDTFNKWCVGKRGRVEECSVAPICNKRVKTVALKSVSRKHHSFPYVTMETRHSVNVSLS